MSVFYSFLILSAVCIYLAHREEVKNTKKRDAEDDAWLEEQMKLPKSRLKIHLVDGTHYLTDEYDPSMSYGQFGWRQTSQERAKRSAADTMKNGFKGSGTTAHLTYYPAHTITKIEIV